MFMMADGKLNLQSKLQANIFTDIMKSISLPYIILLVTQIILAFICGPHSCEWGNTVYFYSGIAGLTLAFLLPILQKAWPVNKRIGYSLLFLFGSVATWCTGFMLGGFRIMCKLF
jgi:hypothetical protein